MRKTAANLCGIVSIAASLAYWIAAYFPLGSSGHLRVLSIFGPDAALKIGLAMVCAAVLGIIAGVLGSRAWLLAGAWALTSLAIGPSFKV
ncbi:MAG: hypothetical protein KGM47_13460 [Acidobacteriota bacterium]|nr:hypothetical protein [Acidobacteriota bacterium]